MKTLLIVLCMSFVSNKISADDISGFYLGASRDKVDNRGNWTAEMGAYSFFANYFLVQGSLMYFEQDEELYEGANLSFSITNGNPLSLYAGVGGFLSTLETCTETNFGEICSDTFRAGVYPEAGLILTMQGAHIGAFARRYKTFDGGKNNFTMIGFRFGSAL